MSQSADKDTLYPGDDSLPDVSKTTFDHTDKQGRSVKFLWGVATSSYQVEGNITTNDWYHFSRSALVKERVDSIAKLGGFDLHLEEPGQAMNHWDLDSFERDLERAKSLGINSYRLSLEWSRIQPNAPRDGLGGISENQVEFDREATAHYEKMLEILKRNDVEPIVTLNHMTLPDWVLTPPTTLLGSEDHGFKSSLGGWENPKTVDAFLRFVEFAVASFSDHVSYWITINEPTSIVGFGYLAGLWPPGFVLAEGRAKAALFNLIEAHAQAYDAIKMKSGKKTKVGLAHAMVFPKVRKDQDIFGLEHKAMEQYDYCFNRVFLEAVIEGRYNPTLMLGGTGQVIEGWKGRLDFVGLNYYRSAYICQNELLSVGAPWVGGVFDENLSKAGFHHNLLSDLGWEVYPAGLYRFLKYIDARFGLPVLITENGLAEQDDDPCTGGIAGIRAPYIVSHLEQVLRALGEGIDVLGYIHWSLIDNWEWDYDYLPKARFGLYTANRTGPGCGGIQPPRKKTRGAEAFEYVAHKGRIGSAKSIFGTVTPSGDTIVPPG